MSGRKSRIKLRQVSLADPISLLDIILEYVLDSGWKDYKGFSRALANRIIEKRPVTTEALQRIIESTNHPFFSFNGIRREDFRERFPSKELLSQSRRARVEVAKGTPKPKHKRTGIGKRLRYLILERDHFQCQLCGRDATQTKLEVDHKIPVAKGGTDSLNNLHTVCFDCNRGKSDLSTQLPT